MSEELKSLLAQGRGKRLAPETLEEQRRSFAFGNAGIRNGRLTREIVDRVAENEAFGDPRKH